MSSDSTPEDNIQDHIITLDGMYQDYFLDYASYVILERAVPAIEDGLKPVQRRILHSMYEQEDGRYHKVANLIGQTMQFHPHGDAAIGEALVNLGQKDLLIDTQGNWGDARTGDSAAAPRYIEARLTKFALEVAFNPDLNEWQLSYDGRKKEPVVLPMKFPLVLAQGVEGIAVGLSTKILPHNFIELIKASIQILKGKKVEIFPDFETGGMINVSEYNQGLRGGRVKVRAKIEVEDKKFLLIKELPYGVTTTSLIDSIVKAADKGKIKIKHIHDNTAADVEIKIELQPGVSPEVTMDALYAFSNCEVSISPNACVIVDNKPIFLKVNELLRISTEHTKQLLLRELEIKKQDILEKWHLISLEKIFIENRIYRDIEECPDFESVIEAIDKGLKKYVKTPSMPKTAGDKRMVLNRDITHEDILHLTEIRIKRISKYNKFQTDESLKSLEADLKQVNFDIENITDFAIAYFERLITKYGKGKERKTKILDFEAVQAVQVVANNSKLYVNRTDGFIGHGLKKDEFVKECSDIDDIIVFRSDAKMVVSRIAEKTFVGKDIVHVDVWKKADERTTYNVIYLDGESGRAMAKRFNVTGITRDKEYDLTKGHPKSKLLYFSVNPEGEAEIVTVNLTAGCSAKIKQFDFNFAEIEIKGRSSGGNIVTSSIQKLSGINKDTIWGAGAQIFTSLGIRGMINRTTNGGENWLYQVPDSTYNNNIYSYLGSYNKLNGWAYLTENRGIHTTSGGDPVWLTPVNQISSEVPKGFELSQNYPNPFNPLTNIKYNVKGETSNVKLIIFDIQGKQLTELINQKQSAGTYQVDFNGSNYSSGVYFYSLIIDGKVIDTKKMILLK